MTLNEYQKKAQSFDLTIQRGLSAYINHAFYGLAEEVGELMALQKRVHRGDNLSDYHEKVEKELGDVLWYVAAVAASHDMTLEEIAQGNLKKLTDRAVRGKIKGKGDER